MTTLGEATWILALGAPQQWALQTNKAVDNNVGHVSTDDEFGRAFVLSSVKDPVGDEQAKFECYLDKLFGVF
jgi:hypothetical protein